MKKVYLNPAQRVVHISMSQRLLRESVTSIDSNASLQYGGGSSGIARGRGVDGWGDEE